MIVSFDLISDLHIETWDSFDWAGQATSPVCVVAGDVAKDHEILFDVLRHLTTCYQAVFYIDGNEEHKYNWDRLGESYSEIEQGIQSIPGVQYLQNNVVIMNGVAIVGSNSWWTWDFDPTIDLDQSQRWWENHQRCSADVSSLINDLAVSDARYLANTIARLQTHVDVKQIVVITHTVPSVSLIEHDIDLANTYRINSMGNSWMNAILESDTEGKISHWCFGHYHGSIDRTVNGIRYVNNCRGRGDTQWRQAVYHPLRIDIKI